MRALGTAVAVGVTIAVAAVAIVVAGHGHTRPGMSAATTDVVTLYGANIRVIAFYGNPANANRIVRPVRRGRPYGP